MNGTIKRENCQKFENEMATETCNFSGYSMAAVVGGILLCIGIIVYAILTH